MEPHPAGHPVGTGSPAPDREWVHVCDRCGERMAEHHCKIVCPRCGYTRDCSDP